MRNDVCCVQKAILSALVLLLTTAVTSCDIYYLDFRTMLKDRSEKVAVATVSFDKTYPLDSESVTCIASSGTNAVTVNLINPQLLPVSTSVTLPAAAVALASTAGVSADNMYTVTQSSDKLSVTISYTNAFLTVVDGNSEHTDSTDNSTPRYNDITPTFSFTDTDDTTKTFGPFTPQYIRVNSVPSRVTDALVMVKTDATTAAKTYVLFFNLPLMTGTQKDISRLTLNCDGTEKSFSVNPKGTSSATMVSAVGNATSGLYASWNDITQGALTNANGATVNPKAYPLYFDTGIPYDETEHSFIITLTDSMELSTSTTATSNAPVLEQPSCAATGTTLAQDSDSVYATLLWNAPSKAKYTQTDGTVAEQTIDAATVLLTVKLYTGHGADTLTTQPFDTQTGTGSCSVQIPHGEYTIIVSASKDGFIESSTSATDYTVTLTRAYVNARSAALIHNGTKDAPYLSITAVCAELADKQNSANKAMLLSDATESLTIADTVLTITSADSTAPCTVTGTAPDTPTISLTASAAGMTSLSLTDVAVAGYSDTATAINCDRYSSLSFSGATTASRVVLATGAYLTITDALTSTAATDGDLSTPVAVLVPSSYTDQTFTVPLLSNASGDMTEDYCDLFTVAADSNNNEYYITSGAKKTSATSDEKKLGYLQKLGNPFASYSQTNGLSGSDLEAQTRFFCNPELAVTYVLTIPKKYTASAVAASGVALSPTESMQSYVTAYTYTLPASTKGATSCTFTLTPPNDTAATYVFIYGGICVGDSPETTELGTQEYPYKDFKKAFSLFTTTSHTSTDAGATSIWDRVYITSDMTIATPQESDASISIATSIPTILTSLLSQKPTLTFTTNKQAFVINAGTYMMSNFVMNGEGETDGGGIYVNGATISFEGVTIKNFTSKSNGAGISLETGDITLSSGTRIQNCATEKDGGGVYCSKSTLTLAGDAEISGNTAANGAGIYGATPKSISFAGKATVTGNTATGKGGGLYIEGTKIPLSTSTINSNEAALGPEVYVASSAQTLILSSDGTLLNAASSTADHSVYLETGATLTLSTALTASAVAVIKPQAYPTLALPTVTVLASAAALTADVVAPFAVAPETVGSAKRTWSIASTANSGLTPGELYYPGAIAITVSNGIETVAFNESDVTVESGKTVTISAKKNGVAAPFTSASVCTIDGQTLTATAFAATSAQISEDASIIKYNGSSWAYSTSTLTPPKQPGKYTVTLMQPLTANNDWYSLTFTLTVLQEAN